MIRLLEDAVDLLEEEARRRALAGSDLLLIFLLKAHRPQMYRGVINIEHHIRRAAEEAGVDPDEAVAEAQRILRNARGTRAGQPADKNVVLNTVRIPRAGWTAPATATSRILASG